MDNILDDIVKDARRCERAARTFKEGTIADLFEKLLKSSVEVGKSWCGSCIGYHSKVYLENFINPEPWMIFDREWGTERAFSNRTAGPWAIYEYDQVIKAIKYRAGVNELNPIMDASSAAEDASTRSKDELLPSIDAILDMNEDKVIREKRDEIDRLQLFHSQEDFIKELMPGGGQFVTRDSLAGFEGPRPPHHLAFLAWVLSLKSKGDQAGELASKSRYILRYLEKKYKMKGKSLAKTEGKVFIGHGLAVDWRDLKDFLRDRLHLEVDEFNSMPVAGLTAKERLEAMLEDAIFAFLVMTAEDERTDGTKHARENVVHEAGLFQGRLGFRRAIIVMEEGCTPFSNIDGLQHIRFKKGEMSAKHDEILRVLEREGVVK